MIERSTQRRLTPQKGGRPRKLAVDANQQLPTLSH